MTANLTVPADVWACQRPGVPLVAAIVEGERCPNANACLAAVNRGEDDSGCACAVDENVMRPPAWLVALRVARCEHPRCQSGRVLTTDRHGSCWVNCRHCVAGRLLHDVRVEDPDGEHDGYTECRAVRCLVDLAGVVESWPRVVGPVQLFVVDDRVWLVVDGQDARQLTPAHVDALAAACGKPPADWVGGWAVILEARDE